MPHCRPSETLHNTPYNNPKKQMLHENPFSQIPYGTPHGTVPFDRLKVAHFEEAMLEGMKQEDAAIQRIVESPEPPTFENVVLPRTGQLLESATTVFYNLLSANTNDEMDALAQKMQPLLTAHSNAILHNEALFAKVKKVWEDRDTLQPDERRLVEKTYDTFVRNGALLGEEDKQEYDRISTRLGQLSLLFNQHLLKATDAYEMVLTDEKDTAGLPERTIKAAAEAAREAGKKGWLFTLHAPSYEPFMTYAADRGLRQRLYMARNTLCNQGDDLDNNDIVREIVNLRLRKAQLLGYPDYASLALEQRMAGNEKKVDSLLRQLLEASLPHAKCQLDDVEALARENEPDGFVMEPWDFPYYSQKLRQRRYTIDSEMLRPYFALDRVRDGIFALAGRLYGIRFHKRTDIPVFHPQVETYEVFDRDNRFLAVLYTDFFPRKGKQSGAWMTQYREQYVDDKGNDVRPHVSLTANFTPPTDNTPSLLSLGEVETFLHEFGHCLHGIFSQCRFASISGTNVKWDFVELPSQIMENYATEPQFIHTFARHWQTGEEIPGNLMDRIVESRQFNAAWACVRQLSFGLLDMAFHTLRTPFQGDVEQFEAEAMRPTTLLPRPQGCCMSVQFSHIMSGGYAAGYYGYKWAEVLDADAFSMFREEGIFNTDTAHRFRDCILSKGDTIAPDLLYRRFRGRDATINALLTRTGIPGLPDKHTELDRRYLRMAMIWSENSYCQRRKVGALIIKDKMIISDGYNGTPSGFPNVCEDEHNVTLPYVLHAEANAITKIARSGNNSEGGTLYVTDSPCIECAKLIIQSGIRRVVYNRSYRLQDGINLLRKAGIEVDCLPLQEE